MQAERLDRRVVLLIAFTCGATVANLYYAQPLLDEISAQLDVSSAAVGLLVTASQIGYAIGLALIVPLGDLLERRWLTIQLLAACAIGLVVTSAAPTFAVLAVALLIVGVTSTVAQVLVPMAASLASEEERGRVIGIVMSGLLIGILVARTISGLLAELGGWRLPFALAAGLTLILIVAMRIVLPTSKAGTDLNYGRLLRSVFGLVRDEPVLRRRMVYGAMGMAGFSILWTALTFLLADTYGYGEATIGLFGLFGIIGASSAQFAGRAADRGWLNQTTGAFVGLVLLSWGLFALGTSSITALIAGIILLDLGIQGQHISNQSAIYARRPESRSRMTTAYMTSNFIWGAIGSASASVAYSAGGWSAVVVLGAVCASVAVLNWLHEQLTRPADAAPATSER